MSRLKQVLVIGRTNAAYRPGMILKYFADRPEKYALAFFDSGYSRGFPPGIQGLLLRTELLISIFAAKTIVVLPMHHHCNVSQFTYKCAKLLRKKVLTDFYISMYEAKIIDRQKFKLGGVKAKKIKILDINAIQSSDVALFLNKAELKYYTKVLGLSAAECPNAMICPLVVPLRKQALLPYLNGLTTTPTIAWWGRMGNPLHGFEVICEAIRILVDDGLNANFAIFGIKIDNMDKFYQHHRDVIELDNVMFNNEYSFSNGLLTEFLFNEADIALGTFGDTQKAKTVLTNKVLDAASFGIPCLTQPSAGLLEYFEPDKNILLSDNSAKALAAKISTALENPSKLIDIGYNSRKLARDAFGPESFEQHFGKAIDKC